MDQIKNLDFFGSKFAFTIGKSQKFKTIFGAVLSIICFALTGAFSFFFGSDFFLRTNPRILMKTEIPDQYFKVNLTHENFLIPWTIFDFNSNPVNFTGIIYPVWTYLRYELNDKNEMIKTLTKDMNSKPCDSKYQYLMNGGVNLTGYWCLDWSEFPYDIGGNDDGLFIDKIQLQIHYCPGRKTYSPTNNCTSLEKLDKIFNPALNMNWYFTFYYPQYVFSPENIASPFKIFYKNYNYALTIGMTKTDRFWFQKPVLFDDQGWIMTGNKTLESLSVLYRTNDFSIFPRDQYYVTGQSSLFYRLVIYMDKTHDVITRSFMKFQELTAIVGGFMKVITSLSFFISQIYSSYKKETYLLNQVFDFSSENDHPFDKNFLENKIIDNNSQLGNSNVNFKENINIIFFKFDNKSNSNLPIEKIMNLDNYLDSYEFANEKVHKHEFGLFFTLTHIFCKGKPNLKKKIDLYHSTTEFLNHKLDISFYLKNLIVFERIRTMIFNSQQNLSMNFLRKFNPNMIEDQNFIISNSSKEKKKILKEVLNYYAKLIRENKMTPVDKNTFDSLEMNIKNLIEKISKN